MFLSTTVYRNLPVVSSVRAALLSNAELFEHRIIGAIPLSVLESLVALLEKLAVHEFVE